MKWRYIVLIAVVAVLATATFFIFFSRNVAITPSIAGTAVTAGQIPGVTDAPSSTQPIASTSTVPTSTISTSTASTNSGGGVRPGNDIGPQPPLINPPAVVKGIYVTAWAAGSPGFIASLINLVKTTELNTVVIDLKDYSGYVSYAMDVPGLKASGAEDQLRIARPNALIKELHDDGIYVIGRVTDFQDPVLAQAHPEWALKNKTTGGVWKDNNGLAWMDPAAQPVWEYLASIARDGFNRGFDEIQFDYIRFASDGALGNISYPYWDMKTPRATVIANYFKYVRAQFPAQKISVDLFGLAAVNSDDLGIGQIIQSAYENFDYVSPMVYPSHYATGFLGYKNPAAYPYQVISYSMERALAKLVAMGDPPLNASSTVRTFASQFNLGRVPESKLRPWLQDFNLGATYTAAMVRSEKQAVYDTLDTATSSQYYGGWLMWDAGNKYTAAALDP